MSNSKTKKTNKREIALQNLKKANEAKKAKRSQLHSDDWEARSRARLERIIEKTERELTKASTMEGVDVAKLTNALKVCHQAYRTMGSGGSERFARTAEEAQAQEEKYLGALTKVFKRLPPGQKRRMRVELTRFRGHLTLLGGGIHDGESQSDFD